MDERSERSVQRYLQAEEVQERIRQNIQRSRIEATVTIGRAASLFGFSESKLRDLETSGHLSPQRSKESKGQRQYSLNELVKLAVIRELLDARYSTSDIPPDIDAIWYTLQTGYDGQRDGLYEREARGSNGDIDDLSISQRIQDARANLAWRYFVSRALRLSLMLIREDIPNTMASLVLPLHKKLLSESVPDIQNFPEIGEALVGWLSRSGSSHTMLTTTPFFQRGDDYYHVLRLQPRKDSIPEGVPTDSTLLLVDRRIRNLNLSKPVVETVCRLLAPLYKYTQLTEASFGKGMRDLLDPSTRLYSNTHYYDITLKGLTEIIVNLGDTAKGNIENTDGQRWRFACIMLPDNLSLAMQQRSLVVKAQSKQAPHQEGVTILSPQGSVAGMCIRAYQSGRVIYFPDISPIDTTIAFHEQEEPIRSAIALPIEGSEGLAIAVLYVVSDIPHAFSIEDQRVLRLMGKMIGEAIETYAIRLRAASGLKELITNPAVVDPLFKDFSAEDEFIKDIEELLCDIQRKPEKQEGDVSFIAIDIDNQSSLANKYGDLITRKLSRAVGLRIRGQIRTFRDDASCELYHLYADRFYILLNGTTLEQAVTKAMALREALSGTYHIDPLHASTNPVPLPENMVQLQNVTVRLGVSSYLYSKIKEVLQRCTSDRPYMEVRIQIMGFLDELLDMGKREGGNVVISWDRKQRSFKRLQPSPLNSSDI